MSSRQNIAEHIRNNDSRAENVMIYRGKDYFYFGKSRSDLPCISDKFRTQGVYTKNLNSLTKDQWLAEFKTRADSIAN